jgi:regulator of replication initiation timing
LSDHCPFFTLLQVLELQNTLDDLTNRVDSVKEENLKLRSENSVLGQYIENLMQASAVFQTVSPKTGRKEASNSSGSNLGTVIRCTARAVRGAQGAASNHP